MAQTSISIKSLDGTGKKLQKSITYVNNAASNEDLAQLGSALNGLTTNEYLETDRVDKANCDTDKTPVKPEPTLTIGEPAKTTVSFADADVYRYMIIFEGEATTLYVDSRKYPVYMSKLFENTWNLFVLKDPQVAVQPKSITVYAPETANFAAKSVTVEFKEV